MKTYSLFFCFIFLIYSCATVVSPSGGPKDTSPPIVSEAIPQNLSTQFSAEKAELFFDEYITFKRLQSQLIISPPMKEKPSITIKGKIIEIDFHEDLMTNTTYTINFGNSIRDITEGNSLNNFQYVFSTGDFVDSLFIGGIVSDAFNKKTEKDILVMLYDCDTIDCDSIPLNSIPLYFSKTDKNGKFKIEHIKEGHYKIFALKDGNRNYLYDLPTEKIAFLKNMVDASDSGLIELSLFTEKTPTQYIVKSKEEQYGKIKLIFNEPTYNCKITPLNSKNKKPWEIIETSNKGDTIVLWYSQPTDTIILDISDQNPNITKVKSFHDTVRIITKKKKDALKFKLFSSVFGSKRQPYFKPISFIASTPITNYDLSKIILSAGDSTKTPLPYSFVMNDPAKRRFDISYSWDKSTSYELVILDSAIRDIFGNHNDSIGVKFNTTSAETYGNIKLKIDLTKSSSRLLLEIINNKGNRVLIDTLTNKTDLFYPNLTPGEYNIKIIFDNNGNYKWDPGDYLKNILPDKVIYYPDPVTIRANWDIELDWKVK